VSTPYRVVFAVTQPKGYVALYQLAGEDEICSFCFVFGPMSAMSPPLLN
jgi:hypothetical protein